MNGFDDRQEDIVGDNGLRNGKDAMLANNGQWVQNPVTEWDDISARQNAEAENLRMQEAQQGFDQNMALSRRLAEERKNAQLQKLRTGAFIQSMVERDGSFDPDMIPEMQRQLGDPSFAGAYMRNRGGANEEYVMLSNTGKTARDLSPQLYSQMMANGGTLTDRNNGMSYRLMPNGMLCVEQVVPDEQRLRLYQDAGLGDRTLQGQTRLYERMLRTSTPETLAQKGIVNPNAGVRTVGSTTIKGSLANRLLGRTSPRSVISSFASDGKGGFSKSYFNGNTGEQWDVDYGTRDPNYKGKWKKVAGATYQTYRDKNGNIIKELVDKDRWENDKTGEVMETNPGESPSSRTSRLEDAKVREADARARESDAKGRLYDAQAGAGGFRPGGYARSTTGNPSVSSLKFDKSQYDAVNMEIENLEAIKDPSDDDKRNLDELRILKKIMLRGGAVSSGVKSEDGGNSPTDAATRIIQGNNTGGSATETPLTTVKRKPLVSRLKPSETEEGGGIVSSGKSGGRAATTSASKQKESKSDFDKENERLISEFKKYGGTVNSDGSFKLGHTDVLSAEDTTDISDRKGISRELVELQKKLFDDKSLYDESKRAEEERIRGELAREYAGNKQGLDKEVKERMDQWRVAQYAKTRAGQEDLARRRRAVSAAFPGGTSF